MEAKAKSDLTMCTDRFINYDVPGTPMVDQKQFVCFNVPGDQKLTAVLETYSNGYRWELQRSFNNNSDTTVEDTVATTTQLRVLNGQELQTNWSIGLQFKGMSVGVGGESKTFQEYETTTTTTHSQAVTIPPRKAAYVYQKVYKFNERMWFILDCWNQLSKVGGHGNYEPSVVTGSLEIHSNEYYVVEEKLDGDSSTTTADWVPSTAKADVIRKFENCSEKCKDYLRDRGVHIP